MHSNIINDISIPNFKPDTGIKGYKAFSAEFTCRDMQYEVGKTYTLDGKLDICANGFHFCYIPLQCDNYYYVGTNPRYAEITAEGNIQCLGDKMATTKITIVRELTRDEMISAMTGKFVYPNGVVVQCQDAKYHREDGPAITTAQGDEEWFQHGNRHRLYGPAVKTIEDNGEEWWVNGERHREYGPAIKSGDSEFWYRYGLLHRIGGPASKTVDTEYWYENNCLHRVDGPAMINSNGKMWYQNDELHRVDGPAIESVHGTNEWYLNGERHRVNGPANESVIGQKEWWQNNRRHREDGPAVKYADGGEEWWINDVFQRSSNATC